MNTAASHALGYPYFPYYPVVLDILRSRLAERVLEAPCSRGWLGDMVRPATGRDVELDGVGPAGLPASANGYRRLTVHDLETPLPAAAPYDAVVCSEAIHLASNPGLLVRGFHDALRPGGTLVLTTPNAGRVRVRLRALLRGVHVDPWSAAARTEGALFPLGFAQLHQLLTHHGFHDITLHSVIETRQGRWLDHLLAWPARRYCQARLKHAQDEDSRHFWRQAGSEPSAHGNWLVVSARRPGER
ncbi:methyltransferase type 11 [Achromobacter xylosoxidans]|uniref:class I SAM-dependent methyltransferase n=1 Tax=Alcaligenes xylosoxydans xylosoxydans TaxID=85698 RepID=UPI00234A35E6|nr:methyltransferase domain-containing protein [Achromobacter xylosoxidans]MDC6163028.1 methyltransferase type 11 [Achromobacter xylosoxidans]